MRGGYKLPPMSQRVILAASALDGKKNYIHATSIHPLIPECTQYHHNTGRFFPGLFKGKYLPPELICTIPLKREHPKTPDADAPMGISTMLTPPMLVGPTNI